jgi:hypothetical protein
LKKFPVIKFVFFPKILIKRGDIIMANNNNQTTVPGAKAALNKMKFEVASQVGVNLKQGYNGDLSASQAGKVGGNITKKLIQMAESQLTGK